MRRLALAAVLLSAAPAVAHPEWSPVRVNRYFKLVLAGEPRVVYTILYGDAPALPERKAADTNGDGKLDADERRKLGEHLAARVASGLHLSLDGHDLGLPTPSIDVGLAGDDASAEPFSVDLTYAFSELAGHVHALTIDDRVDVANEGDSEVAIDETPPARLLAASRGVTAEGVAKVFSFRGPRFSVLEDRRVTARFETTQPTPALRLRGLLERHVLVWLGGAALAIALAIAARRYRSM